MAAISKKHWIDLSHSLDEKTSPFPGDPPVKIKVFDTPSLPGADGRKKINASQITMSLHCGTHMDAPFHFFTDGKTIDQVPLESCVGPAFHLRLPKSIQLGQIDVEDLAPHAAKIQETTRVILNTGWHHRWGSSEYFSEHPVLTQRAAEFLVNQGVRLVGVDTPSVDRPPYEAHFALLGNDVLIVENLTNLDPIRGEVFELHAIPLKIGGRDGSPVRAVAVSAEP